MFLQGTRFLSHNIEKQIRLANTTIDNVGISLKNQEPTAVGIKIGPNANLNRTFIKANIWLGTSGGTGLEIDDQLKYSLVNLKVEDPGTAIHLKPGTTVNDNQNFLLTAINVNNKIINNSTNNHDIITNP